MKIFESFLLKFESPKQVNNPELGLIDMVLEEHPELIKMPAPDITASRTDSNFGRQDTPSTEQIVRAAIYKEMKHLDYRALEYAQEDSRIWNNS
jgi:IS5 family transposase